MHGRRAAEEALVATGDERGGPPQSRGRGELEHRDEHDEHDPVVVAAAPGALDGDDIEVIAGADVAHAGRSRMLLIGAGIVAVVAAVVGIAIAARHEGTSASAADRNASLPPASVPVVAHLRGASVSKAAPGETPRHAGRAAKGVVTPVPTTSHTVARTTPRTNPPNATNIAFPPPASGPATATGPAPTFAIDGAITATLPPPKQYGARVLTWDAPRSFTMTEGTTKTISVRAHNPTDGIVTLPHPLSCTPRLDHHDVCAESVQLIGPGGSAAAQYAIDATGIAPGSYSLTIEGVLKITVTVTAATP